MLKLAPWKIIVSGMLLVANIFFVQSISSMYFSSRELSIPKMEWRGLTYSQDNVETEKRPLSAYAQTLSSPVFFESRSPFVPPQLPPPPPPPSPTPPTNVSDEAREPPMVIDPGLALGGIMILEGTQKAYLFTENVAGGVWVAKGYEFLGWTVLSIDNDGVSLLNGKEILNLKLYQYQ